MTAMSVHALPTELLLDVFNLVAKDPPDKGDLVTVCAGLSHVCQRWRQTAISCEAFWTVLPRRSAQWTNLCLSRCPSAPLQLDFRASMTHDTEYRHAARLVFPRFVRAKHLRLALDHNSATLLEEISAALPAWPLAIIEDVNVTFRRRAYPHVEQPPLLPATLFPSAIQSVHIDSCTLLNAPTIFPPGIRRIELIDVRPWSTVHLVLQFFRTIPQLEYFVYRTTRHGLEVPIDWQAPLPETRCVSLKHLRGLHLEGSLVDNYIIFSILVLQPSVSLTIKELLRNPSSRYLFLVLRGPSVEQYRDLIVRSGSALRSHFSEAIDCGAHYDVVRLDERSINTVCDDKAKPAHNWRHAAILPNSSELSLEALSYNGRHRGDITDIDRASLDAVFSLPIFTPAATIEFGSASPWYEASVLRQFSSSRVVQFNDLDGVQSFASMLGHRISEPLFPMLECIRIAGVRIADSEVNIFELDFTPMLCKTYDDQEIRLELCRCIITQTSLERLRDIMHPWSVLDDGHRPPPPPADPQSALGTST